MLNIILALLAVPPAIALATVAIAEGKIVGKKESLLSKKLTRLFLGVAVGAILNATISLLAITDNGITAHGASPYRSVLLNAFFTYVSWSLYSFHRSLLRRRKRDR